MMSFERGALMLRCSIEYLGWGAQLEEAKRMSSRLVLL